MSDLAKKLRRLYFDTPYGKAYLATCEIAADELERLTAENERLREAGKALRDEIPELRALLRATDGDIVVKASASRWDAFCNALGVTDDT